MRRAAMGMLSVALSTLWCIGCAPQASFTSETFDLAEGRLRVKGWVQGSRFCVEVRFDPRAKGLALHSIALVAAGGQEHPPGSWRDKTPKAPPINVGMGLGIPLGGGGGHGGEHGHGGNGFGLVPGISVPLGGGKKDVTAVEACWNISPRQQTAPVTACTLQVKLISLQPGRARVTTVPLAMTVHRKEDQPPPSARMGEEPRATTQPATMAVAQRRKEDSPPEPAKAKKSAKDLVREIDFTLKAPPTSKSVAL